MSIIETVSDVNNTFLSRRELTCNFAGLGGKLKKIEAMDMISKEFKLDGKIIIPIKLKNHVGKSLVTGTFYVYDDEKLAKKHVNPVIFTRLEKDAKSSEGKTSEIKAGETVEEKKENEPTKEVKSEAGPKVTKTEEKKEGKPKESE